MLSESMAAVKINDIRLEGETLVFDPFNPVNREITEADVRALLTRFGVPAEVPISNMDLYRRAFVHKSYVKRPDAENKERGIVIAPQPPDCMPLKTKSNDRLEFVGDGVLECITKYYLYERFPKSDEGFMTDTKIALVKNEAIGQLALDIGLHRWYVISRNAEQKNTRTNVKKLGNLFEAFLGALFLDSNKMGVEDEYGWFRRLFLTGPGFHVCQVFLVRLFETPGLIPWHKIIETNENYKNQLQVMVQKEFKTVPQYVELPFVSLGDELGFRMGVFLCLGQPIHAVSVSKALPLSQLIQKDKSIWASVHDHAAQHGGKALVLLGEGQHRIKKNAEQNACYSALQLLTV